MQHEARRHEDDHDDALAKKRGVLDFLALIAFHEGAPMLLVDFELAAEQQIEQPDHHDEADDRRRRVDHDEVREREARGRADHDVGRVADEGRRAADVGGHDLGEEERRGVKVEQTTDRDRHGADEQDRRHVVEQGREHRGQADEEHHHQPGVALRKARALDSEVLEKPR